MAGDRKPLTLDPENRLPVDRFQYVNVLFEQSDMDVVIPHRLAPVNAEDVRYEVCRRSSGAVVYQDLTPDRKPWQRTHIYLRASAPTAARIKLFLEAETDAEEAVNASPSLPSGGQPQNAFGVIAVPNQNSVEADQPYDTVTFVAGEGISITTDASGDIVTFTNTCCDEEEGEEGETPVDCGGEIMWTSDPQKVIPSADDGVAITPSGSVWGNSAWVEVEDSTTAPWLLTGVSVVAGTTGVQFEIDVGTGSAGAERVIGTVRGTSESGLGVGYLFFPIPIENIALSDRVAVRLRKTGTNTTDWNVALTYYQLPIEGAVTATIARCRVTPAAASGISIADGGSAWTSGSYTTLVSATPLSWAIGAVTFSGIGGAVIEWELDLATGSAGNEEIITTVRSRQKDNGASPGGPNTVYIRPCLVVGEGERISARLRTEDGSQTYGVALTYYHNPQADAYTFDGVIKQAPAAANGVAVTPGNNAFGAWVEVLAASSSEKAVVGTTCAKDTTGSVVTLEFGTGAAGAESALNRVNYSIPNVLTGGNLDQPLMIAFTVPANERLAVRAKDSGTANVGVSVAYVEDPDFAQLSSAQQDAWSINNVTSGASWSSGDWEQAVSSAPMGMLLTGISASVADERDWEVDIGVGEAGSETVVTTLRFSASGLTTGKNYVPLPLPTRVESASRVAIRTRNSGTALSRDFKIHYILLDPPEFVCEGPDPEAECCDAFGTVTVSGEGSVQADAPNTTLTFAEGAGIGLSLDDATKTLTIASTVVTGANTRSIVLALDGGGDPITTGIKADLYMNLACTITSAVLLADQTGSIVIDIWKDTYANYAPTDADSITASAPPTISSATKSKDTTLTGWTTAIAADTTLRFNVDSCSTITRAVLVLTVTLT